MMKHCLLLILITFSQSIHAQQKITFEYDSAGNQVKRELCISNCDPTAKQTKELKETVATTDEDLQKFFPEDVLSYYPNPVREELYLKWQLTNETYVKSLAVYSFNGQKLKSYSQSDSTNTQTIPFQGFPSGMYLVVLEYNNGEQKTIKIVKK